MKAKMIIDILMTAGLFFVSGYQLWGESTVIFYLDYLALMGTFVFVGHLIMKKLR